MFRVVVALAIVLSTSPVFADEATARKRFSDGERAYNLGEFDKAVELFKQAYSEWPEPAFLFNVAQTYRQAGDCKQALFFYKRFLALKQNDTKKPINPALQTEVEKRIVELEECLRRELASKPPDALESGTTPPTTPARTPPTTPTPTTPTPTTTAQVEKPVDDKEFDDRKAPTEPASSQPSLISARVELGAGKLTAGELVTPIQFAGAVVVGHPLSLGDKLTLELGAALSVTPAPYEAIGVLANFAPTYALTSKLGARLDIGVGAQIFSGLGNGNPFTEMGTAPSGPLTTLLVRAAISADFAVTPNVVLTATPLAFGYSPAPSGFLPAISSLTTLSFMVGVAYRR
jgi:tetratricopeptide (TPR) repeat protein